MDDEIKNLEDGEVKKSHIELLKHQLMTSKNIDSIRPNRVHKLTQKAMDVPRAWADTGTQKAKKGLKHPTFFKKFFWTSFFIMIASLIFAFFYLSGGGNIVTNKKIDFEVLGNSFVSGGEKANFDVVIVNKNSVELQMASLLIKYDKGVGAKIPASERVDIGTIISGETKRVPYSLPIIGQEGEIKEIIFDLEYRVQGSNALFVKTTSTQITLRSSVLGLGIDAPNVSSPGKSFSLKVTLTPNGVDTLKNIALRVEYPTGFNFSGSSPETFTGSNLWYLGDLTAGTPQVIVINGLLSGTNDDERVFRFYAGEFDRTRNTISPIYISKIHSVILNNPFLTAQINEASQIVPIQTGQNVPVTISWQNNTDQAIRDIEILASLSGSAYDPTTIDTNNYGEFYADQNTIVWDGRNNDGLSLARSGESGSVSFSFTPKASALVSGSNKSVNVTISIRGIPVDSVSEIEEFTAVDSKTYKLGTSVSLDQSVVFNSGPFKNVGTLQPKIGQANSYTVLWSLSNTESVVSGAQVKATLNKNFEWLGEVSPTGENVSYNPASREIIWNVGDLKQNPSPNIRRQIYFKVGLTPRQAQLGEIPTVLDRSLFFGTDTLNGSQINQSKNGLRLNNVEGTEVRVLK